MVQRHNGRRNTHAHKIKYKKKKKRIQAYLVALSRLQGIYNTKILKTIQAYFMKAYFSHEGDVFELPIPGSKGANEE